tara:strand:+ start:604 stop:756 length:153 start_codon:yes stop_codon:yes gene_type:complete
LFKSKPSYSLDNIIVGQTKRLGNRNIWHMLDTYDVHAMRLLIAKAEAVGI